MGLRHDFEFTAKDKDGRLYTISVFTNMTAARSRLGGQELEGLRSLETEDGETVMWLEKGRYRIIQTEVELTSDDPNAP